MRRLEAAREEAIAAAIEEGYRIWRMYMAGMACAFARGWLSVYRTLAQKSLLGGMVRRPWTRRDQYLPAAPCS
jgi:cyclopropane-fatty-acyl-phospholipid synthase